MAHEITGALNAVGTEFGIVVSRWNSFITDKMLAGALDTLKQHGAEDNALTVLHVPGSWELPVAAAAMARCGRFDAVIAIGCLIRGETPHFEYLSQEVTRGLGSVALETGVPVTYGVITVESMDQAIERAGAKAGNKGVEAAMAAIEMSEALTDLQTHLVLQFDNDLDGDPDDDLDDEGDDDG